MVPWHILAEQHPDLARRGEQRLFTFGGGLAFLSTRRGQAAPSVQPAVPSLRDGHLYVQRAIAGLPPSGASPGEAFALQAFPLAGKGTGDFFLAGMAVTQATPVHAACGHRRYLRPAAAPTYELLIAWALYSGWDKDEGGQLRAIRLQWHAAYQHARAR